MRFVLSVAFVLCFFLWTEPWWLPFFPHVFAVPSWLPRWAAVAVGIPWVDRGRMWYSQFGQDRWVALGHGGGGGADKAMTDEAGATRGGDGGGGYFVELGAHDGVKNSNTKTLEERFGWRGLCIEPDPLYYRLLSYHRPRCVRRNVLVGAMRGAREKFVSGGILGGIFGGMGGNTGMAKWKEGDEHKKHQALSEAHHTVLSMTTVTLTDVLDEVKAPRHIEYFSLDVEGNELAVLMGLDHDKYTFGAITVEHNFQESARREVYDFLVEKGYDRMAAGDERACDIEREDKRREGLCGGGGQAGTTEGSRGGGYAAAVFCPCVDDFYVRRQL